MIRNGKFMGSYSLAELTTQLDGYEILWGALVDLGNHEGSTVGTFDSDKSGAPTLVLRPGGAQPRAGETVVCTGTVRVLGQSQQVTAYHK